MNHTNPPSLRRDAFLWAWLCVNSRCVYLDLHYTHHADNFTMAPLLDMANHTPIAARECKVRYNARDGLELYAPSDGVAAGAEVCITYGAHANALLLAEYGFVLPFGVHSDGAWKGNQYAEILVDSQVDALLDAQGEMGEWKRALLREEGYWGDYTMHPAPAPAHPSHRLHVALQLVCLEVQSHTEQNTAGARSKEDAARQWRLTIQGMRESISRANENAVRSTLQQLCAAAQQEAATKQALLAPLPPSTSKSFVMQLLAEQDCIAKLVCEQAMQ
ncbi:hypothetical protein MVES1_003092 [Malassezia vespertilionis]|uniref:uncharacterized protein n=1 Tax=Malassezia vespertilionis TaxID=2020962 RepID=UPI0024B16AF6|nr:uncharacterized protein MVES1_003092 [Malassezia vespertilionis]WFD07722.1 hypothetical protein MVES1_003092 [Malassezia vespertilionis]